jgi:hypothetical protein
MVEATQIKANKRPATRFLCVNPKDITYNVYEGKKFLAQFKSDILVTDTDQIEELRTSKIDPIQKPPPQPTSPPEVA